ncbi:NAD(P)/FAD-dependent oxidoreductase [Salinirarus marinus]|uniref:NAD(P)/FAD-dependent oxidoreductase n=1 Tax=Salinirarus marinus TaxID=3068310 RepID=UPI003C6BEB5B
MRVLVLGGGYAGVTVARRLERSLPDSVDLVVVDDSGTHLVQHELHRVIRRPAVADAIAVPLDEVLPRADVVTARVDEVDADGRRVALESGDVLDYDFAVVCLGASTAFHGLPGVRENATPLKRRRHAERIRADALGVCASGGRIVVGGAGLSGVQTAGELAALADERDADAEVVLLERLDDVAPSFPANFRAALADELDAAGVDVRTNVRVTGADADGVHLDDGTLPYDAFVWTGGITGTDAMDGDRPSVRSDLRVARKTFAVGDAARVVDADGEAVPASAATAIGEARTVAENVARLVEHERAGSGAFDPRLDSYRFDVPGWVVSVGDGAVAQLGPAVLRGTAAKTVKASIGVGHLGSIGAVQRAVKLVEEELP